MYLIIYLCIVCLWVGGRYVWRSEHNLYESTFSFHHVGSWGPNSCHQAWWKAPLCGQPSCSTPFLPFFNTMSLHSPGWLSTFSNPPSASRVLGLQHLYACPKIWLSVCWGSSVALTSFKHPEGPGHCGSHDCSKCVSLLSGP